MSTLGFQKTQPLYDTVQFAAAAAGVYTFFTSKIGDIIAGTTKKTKQYTNMTLAGQLQRGQSMIINAISFALCEQAAGTTTRYTMADALIIFNTGFLEFILGERTVFDAPLRFVGPAGQELNVFSNITAAATEYHVNHGVSHIANKMPLDVPINLTPESETFRVQVTIPGTVVAVTDGTITLWGTQIVPA